jgi:hypothetical protein
MSDEDVDARLRQLFERIGSQSGNWPATPSRNERFHGLLQSASTGTGSGSSTVRLATRRRALGLWAAASSWSRTNLRVALVAASSLAVFVAAIAFLVGGASSPATHVQTTAGPPPAKEGGLLGPSRPQAMSPPTTGPNGSTSVAGLSSSSTGATRPAIAPPTSSPRPAACAGTEWRQVASNASGASGLAAVVAGARSDAWAVGSAPGNRTLIEHWDGQTWSPVPSANPGAAQGLRGVAQAGPNQAWAVGYEEPPDGSPNIALIEQWNGQGWSVVSTGSSTPGSELNAVAALSPSDVWAVGQSQAGGSNPTTSTSAASRPSGPVPSPPSSFGALIEHWDGGHWSTLTSPNPDHSSQILSGIAGSGPSDVWAVGSSNHSSGQAILIEHWNGSGWSIMPTNGTGSLSAVAALSPSDAWAVGTSVSGGALIEHWDGRAWTQAEPAQVGAVSGSRLYGVTAIASNDVWAAGAAGNGTLVEHWDGMTWSVVRSPSPDQPSLLSGITTDPTHTTVWAVGTDAWQPGTAEQSPGALIERYC